MHVLQSFNMSQGMLLLLCKLEAAVLESGLWDRSDGQKQDSASVASDTVPWPCRRAGSWLSRSQVSDQAGPPLLPAQHSGSPSRGWGTARPRGALEAVAWGGTTVPVNGSRRSGL